MTTTDTTSWAEVGDRLRALALKLQLHAEEERAEQAAANPTPNCGAFDRFAEALRTTVEAVADAVKDPAVHADVRDAGEAFADAVHNSLAGR